MRARRGALRRALRAVHHAVVYASRNGRAAEIAGWSNALAALGTSAAAYRFGELGLVPSLVVFVLAFVALRLALAHRLTIGLAALAGTLAVAAAGGVLVWTFAHVFESWPWAPQVGGVIGALASALAPAWAYATLAKRRAAAVPDSLLSPVSSR